MQHRPCVGAWVLPDAALANGGAQNCAARIHAFAARAAGLEAIELG